MCRAAKEAARTAARCSRIIEDQPRPEGTGQPRRPASESCQEGGRVEAKPEQCQHQCIQDAGTPSLQNTQLDTLPDRACRKASETAAPTKTAL